MKTLDAKYLIKRLKLKPLEVEGGYFNETYRSKEKIGKRSVSTAIYYLLTEKTYSRIHKISSDEIFHFYAGDPVEMLQFDKGKVRKVVLGSTITAGMLPQVIVKKNVWQGARLKKGGKFALLGTTVAPGFDYADYQNAESKKLTKAYPKYKKEIKALS